MIARMKETLARIVSKTRAYRFDGERANHEQQAQETETSLGLLAAAAQQSDDDSRLHVLGSEAAHRARLARLNALDREMGLTATQQGERASILAALEQLREQREALAGPGEATARPRGFAFLAPAMAANPLLAALMTPWTLVVVALALAGVQTGRLNHAKHDLTESRAAEARLERTLTERTAERDAARDAANDANHDNAETARMVEAERARRLRAEREARRIRDAMEQARAGGPVDYGFGSVRPSDGSPGADSGDAAGRHPG